MIEEKTISSDRVYTGKTISLKVETVEVPNRGYQKREIVEHNGAVGIVAITPENKVVLVRQYRKAVEKELWEIPAGKIEIGENPKECAIRELKEETGYSAENMKLIHKFYTSAGFSNQKIYIFLAENLIQGERNLDEDEFLEVHEIDKDEVYNMIARNEIEDAKTSIGILLIKELI
ncbi:NUDIX hydrolase [Romboutsia ilealis]|uniref:NUDIX hydrolase n=1 Tax=Romboutsia faecis TaxID=2764597 RepID=A0ABR7JMS3_9FIRM|nr:NUDIX hydrolase [Romboutsia faecis]MBC5996067.1 NUDIX hydrolase [Romboutsia faecis]MRN23267.1 NUDIX hydrolase [Romboutsia ilealis]